MSNSIATLSIDIGANGADATKFLQQLQSQLVATDAAAHKAAASIGNAFSGIGSKVTPALKTIVTSSQQAADAELRLAQAEARGLSIKGQLAAASQRLSAAIATYSQVADNSAASILRLQQAENQLATVHVKLNAEMSAGAKFAQEFGQGVTSGIAGIAGPAALAATAIATLSATVDRAKAGFKLSADIEQTTRALGVIVGSQQRANQSWSDASKFADQYQFKLSEINTALGSMSTLLATSTTNTTKQLEVLARLQTLAPGKSFEEAAFSVKELASLDYASLAEQFNISRTAARGLRDEIAQGADVFTVLDRYLNQVGASTAVLSARTEGAAGSINRYQKAQEDFNLALGRFVTGPGAQALDLLTKLSQAGTNRLTLHDDIAAANGEMVRFVQNYQQYIQLQESNNRSVLNSTGGSTFQGGQGQVTPQLSEAQFNYARSLTATGVAASDAAAKAEQMRSVFVQVGQVQAANAQSHQLTASALDQLANSIINVSAQGDQEKANVAGLVTAYQQGKLSAADLQAALATLAQQHQQNAQATQLHASAAQVAAGETDKFTASIQKSAEESTLDAVKKEAQTLATQALGLQANATANEFIANLNPGMSASAAAAAAAAAGLSPLIAQLVGVQVEASKARSELLALNNQKQTTAVNQVIALNRATGQMGRGDAGDTRLDREAVGKQLADQRNAEINLAQAQNNHAKEIALLKNAQVGLNKDSADYINLQAKIVKAEDDAAKAGKKRAAGGSAIPGISNARLTDQQKLQNSLLTDQESFANKSEQEETKHQQKLTEIDTQYAQRRSEVDKKFHLDRLQGEADFYEGLSSIKDRGVQKQIDAQYQQALLKAEEIARSKGGDAANAFLDAQTSIIQKRGSLLDKIAGLTDKKGKDKQTQQSDANQAEYLKGVLALQERASALKLSQVEGEGSAIANERQRQLDDENAHFQDAMNQLGVKAEDSATTRINASIRAAKQIDTEALSVDNLGAAYNRIARGTGTTTGTAAPSTPVTDAVQAVATADVTKTTEGGNPVVAALNSAASAIVAAIGAVERAENNTTRAVRGISVSPLVTR